MPPSYVHPGTSRNGSLNEMATGQGHGPLIPPGFCGWNGPDDPLVVHECNGIPPYVDKREGLVSRDPGHRSSVREESTKMRSQRLSHPLETRQAFRLSNLDSPPEQRVVEPTDTPVSYNPRLYSLEEHLPRPTGTDVLLPDDVRLCQRNPIHW